MNLQLRLFLSLSLIFFLIVLGVVGYSILEHWSLLESLYMTIITLTTVGFTEVRPLSESGRIFTIIFIILGIGSAGFSLTTLFGYIFEGPMMQSIKERKMELLRRKLKDHHILCGYTAISREVLIELNRQKIHHLLIDKNPAISLPPNSKYTAIITGDVHDEEILKHARIEHAQSLIASLNDDTSNLFLVVTARQMNPIIKIISEASDEATAKKLTRAGADIIVTPYQIADRKIAASLLKPRLINFLDIISGDDEDSSLKIKDYHISKHSALLGKSLRETNIGQTTGAVILSIVDKNGNSRITQTERISLASLPLKEDDYLIAMGSSEQLQKLEEFIHAQEKFFKLR
ncbi:MAG TPA: NAD-binding protein [Spirochaetales bacterium]|nr:NAD-binding protein [Spirochaetales bacterium]